MTQKNHGFTLIEISIVVVIIGLIIGGTIVGQSMIRSSQLQSVVADQDAFRKAALTFKDKYKGLPGDLSNATSFWGTAAVCPTIVASDTYAAATCNGNGDGYITDGTNTSVVEFTGNSNEHLRLWQHLSNAELVNTKYTGVIATGSYVYKPDVNLPSSRISDGLYTMFSAANVTDAASSFVGSYGHVIVFGARSTTKPTNSSTANNYPVITGAEALQIDLKTDDGKPNSGIIRTYNIGVADGPIQCVNGTPAYRTDLGSSLTCSLIFITGF